MPQSDLDPAFSFVDEIAEFIRSFFENSEMLPTNFADLAADGQGYIFSDRSDGLPWDQFPRTSFNSPDLVRCDDNVDMNVPNVEQTPSDLVQNFTPYNAVVTNVLNTDPADLHQPYNAVLHYSPAMTDYFS